METIDFFDNVKIEKANAILKYNRLRNLAKLFRLIELCLALIFLSWISAHLPVAFRISGEYLKILISFALSPLFIFVLCNVIVVTLLANSGKLSGQFSVVSNVEPDLFEDFLKHSETNVSFRLESSPVPVPVPEPETIVYEDKNMNTTSSKASTEVIDSVSNQKVLRRSQSESIKIVCSEKQSKKLRRTETERCHRFSRYEDDDISEEKEEIVEELSNEEFQRTIEAFIAKQVKFHQEEKFAIVAPTEGFNDCHI